MIFSNEIKRDEMTNCMDFMARVNGPFTLSHQNYFNARFEEFPVRSFGQTIFLNDLGL